MPSIRSSSLLLEGQNHVADFAFGIDVAMRRLDVLQSVGAVDDGDELARLDQVLQEFDVLLRHPRRELKDDFPALEARRGKCADEVAETVGGKKSSARL